MSPPKRQKVQVRLKSPPSSLQHFKVTDFRSQPHGHSSEILFFFFLSTTDLFLLGFGLCTKPSNINTLH